MIDEGTVSKTKSSGTWLRSLGVLLVSGAACFSAALIGGLATSTTLTTWYVDLRKPSWNPPSWVFGPVWTYLYASMAVSAWLMWRRYNRDPLAARSALKWFAVQLALNAAWPFFFFGMRRPGWAVVEIAVLWTAILITIVKSWPIHKLAAILLVPYILWVTFATCLNAAIARMNA
jgi:tryptophan-rich sensory protein